MNLRRSPENIASDLLAHYDTYSDALAYAECMVRNLVSRKFWDHLVLWDEALKILKTNKPRTKNFLSKLDECSKVSYSSVSIKKTSGDERRAHPAYKVAKAGTRATGNQKHKSAKYRHNKNSGLFRVGPP